MECVGKYQRWLRARIRLVLMCWQSLILSRIITQSAREEDQPFFFFFYDPTCGKLVLCLRKNVCGSTHLMYLWLILWCRQQDCWKNSLSSVLGGFLLSSKSNSVLNNNLTKLIGWFPDTCHCLWRLCFILPMARSFSFSEIHAEGFKRPGQMKSSLTL